MAEHTRNASLDVLEHSNQTPYAADAVAVLIALAVGQLGKNGGPKGAEGGNTKAVSAAVVSLLTAESLT